MPDYTAARLLNAYHAASNQAQGAQLLLDSLSYPAQPLGTLPLPLYELARATCQQLTAAATEARAAWQVHAAPTVPVEPFDAAAHAQQQHATGQMQKIAA